MDLDSSSALRPRRVFISYAAEDAKSARSFARALNDADLNVWLAEWHLEPGQDIETGIYDAIQRADVVVLLVSSAALESRWFRAEMEAAISANLDKRGVDVIPVRLDDSEMPPLLQDRQWLDATGAQTSEASSRLITAIQSVGAVELEALEPRQLELLVGDLLRGLGFHVTSSNPRKNPRMDFRATYRAVDPFGRPSDQLWLVMVKAYKVQRIGVSFLHDFEGSLLMSDSSNGLLVTNGRITSVAADYLESTKKGHLNIRVIDGLELKKLILAQPDLVRRYFQSRKAV